MKRSDHLYLAKTICREEYKNLFIIQKLAYLYGNIEPDLNILTYLHGHKKGEKLRGHNYEKLQPIIKKLIWKLQSRELRENNLLYYYCLGKLSHYTADIFTYPHNEIFKGTLSEHMQYEKELTDYLRNTIGETLHKALSEQPFLLGCNLRYLEANIEELHEDYLAKAGEIKIDCAYIILLCSSLAAGYKRYTPIEKLEIEKQILRARSIGQTYRLMNL